MEKNQLSKVFEAMLATVKFEVTYMKNGETEKKTATYSARNEGELRSAFKKLHTDCRIVSVKRMVGEAEEQDPTVATAEQVGKVFALLGVTEEMLLGLSKKNHVEDMYERLAAGLTAKALNGVISKLKSAPDVLTVDQEVEEE